LLAPPSTIHRHVALQYVGKNHNAHEELKIDIESDEYIADCGRGGSKHRKCERERERESGRAREREGKRERGGN
jgi:hypothetical protein